MLNDILVITWERPRACDMFGALETVQQFKALEMFFTSSTYARGKGPQYVRLLSAVYTGHVGQFFPRCSAHGTFGKTLRNSYLRLTFTKVLQDVHKKNVPGFVSHKNKKDVYNSL